MPLKPNISYKTIDSVVDSTFKKTMVIVGQSNDASEGLYKGVEIYDIKKINSVFGEDSHLASMLRPVISSFADSIVKPQLWVISYQDEVADVARVLDATVAGTATEDKTMKIKLNSLNPDAANSLAVAELSLRNTKGAYCGNGTKNGVERGLPRNANMPFNPYLSDIFTNDTVVEVEITNAMTAAQAASAIDTAINASLFSVYDSSVLSEVCTLTAVHKGVIGQLFTVEFTEVADGLSVSLSETTAGSGVPDVSAILDITDDNNDALSSLDFDFIVLPYGYSVSALVTDAKAKWDNVLAYNNRCLDYLIFRNTALDLTTSTEIDSLATSEPVEENGIVKVLGILAKDSFKIKGINDYSQTQLVESKQFTTLLKEQDGRISVGDAYTLSNSTGFDLIERVLTASLVRQVIVEKFIPVDFPERNFTFGNAVNSYTYNKQDVIAKFEYYIDILDGTVVNSAYGLDYAGILDNNEEARARFSELLEQSVTFDSANKQLIVKLANELANPIKSILITAYFS